MGRDNFENMGYSNTSKILKMVHSGVYFVIIMTSNLFYVLIENASFRKNNVINGIFLSTDGAITCIFENF